MEFTHGYSCSRKRLPTIATTIAALLLHGTLFLLSNDQHVDATSSDNIRSVSYLRQNSLNNSQNTTRFLQKFDFSPPSCTSTPEQHEDSLQIAYLGNSILFFNDCPRLVESMLRASGVEKTISETCLQGGATLFDLYDAGCGMVEEYSPNDEIVKGSPGSSDCKMQKGSRTVDGFLQRKDRAYDFVILNDQTQAPARPTTRADTIFSLEYLYKPVWPSRQDGSPAVPIFLQTAAYRVPVIMYTADLGMFDEFSDFLKEGILEYQKSMNKILNSDISLIAPVGEGYRYFYDNDKNMFDKLYTKDNYHPSPYGTYLQACIIFITIKKQAPPLYNEEWWNNARSTMMHDDLPTNDDAAELRRVACLVTNTPMTAGSSIDSDNETSSEHSSSNNNTVSVQNNNSSQENSGQNQTNKNNQVNNENNSNSKNQTNGSGQGTNGEIVDEHSSDSGNSNLNESQKTEENKSQNTEQNKTQSSEQNKTQSTEQNKTQSTEQNKTQITEQNKSQNNDQNKSQNSEQNFEQDTQKNQSENSGKNQSQNLEPEVNDDKTQSDKNDLKNGQKTPSNNITKNDPKNQQNTNKENSPNNGQNKDNNDNKNNSNNETSRCNENINNGNPCNDPSLPSNKDAGNENSNNNTSPGQPIGGVAINIENVNKTSHNCDNKT